MTNQIYHIVYLTTNLTNNKIYVGIHSTKILDDKYLGSGKIIKKALLKYGAENFKKDILYFCLSIKDALEIEKQIVDNNFIKRKDTYNLVIGGAGGSLATYNSNKKGKKIEEILGSKRGAIFRKNRSNYAKLSIALPSVTKRNWEEKYGKERANILKKERANQVKQRCNHTYIVTPPNNEEFTWKDSLVNLCKEYNLSFQLVNKNLNNGIISCKYRRECGKNTQGWEVKRFK